MTITPFPASGVHLPVPSDREVADTIAAARSEATRRAYGTQWGLFTAWAEEVGLQSLPVSPATVARYLVARHQAGASVATVRASATAIGQAHKAVGHPSPVPKRPCASPLPASPVLSTDPRPRRRPWTLPPWTQSLPLPSVPGWGDAV